MHYHSQDPFFQPSSAFPTINVSLPLTPLVKVDENTYTTNFSVSGIRVFQFSNQAKQQLAQLISGKPYDDALQILKTQKGIRKVSVTTSGFGGAMPTDLKAITFVIKPAV